MENLKAIIVFLLFWSIAIWCVRVVKRKHKKQIMKSCRRWNWLQMKRRENTSINQ